MADRPAVGAFAAATYLRTPASGGGTRRRQTIEIRPRGIYRSDTSVQRAYIDPYAFIPAATPGSGPNAHKRGVEMGICPLVPASACGQGRRAMSAAGDTPANIANEIVRSPQMY